MRVSAFSAKRQGCGAVFIVKTHLNASLLNAFFTAREIDTDLVPDLSLFDSTCFISQRFGFTASNDVLLCIDLHGQAHILCGTPVVQPR